MQPRGTGAPAHGMSQCERARVREATQEEEARVEEAKAATEEFCVTPVCPPAHKTSPLSEKARASVVSPVGC